MAPPLYAYTIAQPILSSPRLGIMLPLYESGAGRIFLAFHQPETIKPVLRSELAQMEG